MTRNSYITARRALRRAYWLDRRANDARRADEQYADIRIHWWPTRDHEEAALAGLTPREREAITARPYRAFNESQRLPLGPRAMAIYTRGGMDLNKRVALRKAVAEIGALERARRVASVRLNELTQFDVARRQAVA